MSDIYIKNLQNFFTQSELTIRAVCPRRWYYQYVRMLKMRGMWNWSFKFGEAMHSFLEAFYRGEEGSMVFCPPIGPDVVQDQAFRTKYEFWKIVFPAYCKAYERFYREMDLQNYKIEAVERLAIREYRGLKFGGKMDLEGIVDGHPFIMDHKTTWRIDLLDEKQLHHKFQFLFYAWLRNDPDGTVFICNQIKTPALRLKKSETEEEFALRCAEDILANPEDYFLRQLCFYSAEEIKAFEKNVLDPKIDILHTVLESEGNPEYQALWRDMNLDSCYNFNTPCPFLSLCFEGEDLVDSLYESKTSKHEELESVMK